ncbi:LYR motif-containing protein 4B-like [Centruroides vittatus]|uniref:LYR motif-containing protein 4B-like n=1 Tax=Centruroides vittatus TaxID=120091 RepID=UPI00350F225A
MAAARSEVISLYKQLLKESQQFSNFIYRSYALRRIKDAFRQNKNETDPEKLKDLISYGKENLEIIKRQVVIGKLYKSPELVIESKSKSMKGMEQ